MVMLARSGYADRIHTEFSGTEPDAIYCGGEKIYGKNLWTFSNGGYLDQGTASIEAVDGKSTTAPGSIHYKFTVQTINSSTKIWSVLLGYLFPGATTTSYDTAADYTFSCWVKSSLPRFRIYQYMGAVGTAGDNLVKMAVDCTPNEWIKIIHFRKPVTADATINNSLLAFRFFQTDHPGVNIVGQTLEVKEVKLELGTVSPFSIHKSIAAL